LSIEIGKAIVVEELIYICRQETDVKSGPDIYLTGISTSS